MESASVRATKPDDYIKLALTKANGSAVQVAELLFAFDSVRDSTKTRVLLEEATKASDEEVRGLAFAIAPTLADSVAMAWRRLESFTIALPSWAIGESAVAANRSIWLRDLLHELSRFEFPPKTADAMQWLAIHYGAYTEKADSEFTALIAKLIGGPLYKLGLTGCDHIGRLLACELAKKDRDADNLLDTLRLVGLGRHPALSPEVRRQPFSHVARALALSGREDAVEALCETISIDRDNVKYAVTAVVQATAASVEAFSMFPDVLPNVLETIAGELVRARLDRESLASQLTSLIALPATILAQPTCDSLLRRCADALRSAKLRQQMICSNDDEEVFIGFWADSCIDLRSCVNHLLNRYEEAHAEERHSIKFLIRSIARIREGQSLSMRPIWVRILKESLCEDSSNLNVPLLAEALNFGAASGLTLKHPDLIPADDVLELLVEIKKRLRNETLMTELVQALPGKSSFEIENMLVRLLVLNLAGRPGDVLLPFVDRMDTSSIAVLANADLSKTDIAMRKAIFERSSIDTPHGPKLMVRAVAAAESTGELLDWLREQHRISRSINSLFAFACALRHDRLELWRQLLQASKKDQRQLGMDLLDLTLRAIDSQQRFEEAKIVTAIAPEIVVDCETIRRDVSLVLDEYEAAQSKKKSGDNLKTRSYLNIREWSRALSDIELEANKESDALKRLCELVAGITGLDRSRFIPTPPQPPQDRGSHGADIFGKASLKLLETAAGWAEELRQQSLSTEEMQAQFGARIESRGDDLREEDGSELLRAHQWLWGPGDWKNFDEKVLRRANESLTAYQTQRIAQLRPPTLRIPQIELLKSLFLSLRWTANYCYDDTLLAQLDWYESVLANLPADIQSVGPTAEHSIAPHPPHNAALNSVYQSVDDFVRWKKNDNQTDKQRVRQRLWPLLWWTASFGGRVERIDATAIASAVSSGQASLADLVWYLVQPGYSQTADNLTRALEYPDRLYLKFNTESDQEILAVVEAVAHICRQQEQAVDPLLPATLAESWRKIPAPKNQNGLRDILIKYADVAYQTTGRTDDKQKAFVARLRESLDEAEQSWIVSTDYFAPKFVKFDVLDAWLDQTTQELKTLVEARSVNEDNLLRIAFRHPLLLRSVMTALGRRDQLEAAIWIAFHAGCHVDDLAITLNEGTGHSSLRRHNSTTQQLKQRFLEHYKVSNADSADSLGLSPVEVATIRRSWKEAAIDAHPRTAIEPMLKALKAIVSPSDRLRVEGLLDAMDGKLNAPEKRRALEATIQDRPNLALLQLALLPLPENHDAVVVDVSQRLKVFEAMSVAGRKRKTIEAKNAMRRALDQFRRTLADNAGLADPIQLDWLSGESIAIELAEFERCESGDYVVQLRLKADGPHVLVTKSGKALKSVPAAIKSTEKGKRLIELQNRLKISVRDARAVLENAMLQQLHYSPDELKLMLKHPVVAALASGLVFGMPAASTSSMTVFGLPSHDGKCLIDSDGKQAEVTQHVLIAHPINLDDAGTLERWKLYFTDRPPQTFQQVDRAIVRFVDLETAEEGKRVVRHDGARIANEDQAFRILQAHGWHDDRDIHQMCKIFKSHSGEEITAILYDFMCFANSIGTVGFRGPDWSELPIAEVPPIILSEAIRDIDRTISGAQG